MPRAPHQVALGQQMNGSLQDGDVQVALQSQAPRRVVGRAVWVLLPELQELLLYAKVIKSLMIEQCGQELHGCRQLLGVKSL